MDRYDSISKHLCPECVGKLYPGSNIPPGNFSVECRECGIFFHFNDDMGPGSYSERSIKGGKAWVDEKLEEAKKVEKQHMDLLKEVMNTPPPKYDDQQ